MSKSSKKEKPNLVVAVLEKAIADRKKKHADLQIQLDAPSPYSQATKLLHDGLEKARSLKGRQGLDFLDDLQIQVEKLKRKRRPSTVSILDKQFALEDEIRELESALSSYRFRFVDRLFYSTADD